MIRPHPHRLPLVLLALGMTAGVREYRISRAGHGDGGPHACEASAASCFSISRSALASPDPEFWTRHARMVDVVARLNPDDPDTDFLRGMEALASGDEDEFARRFDLALSRGVKHNPFLLHFHAQYLLNSGADWERVNRAVNRWRTNHQLSRETLSLGVAAGPANHADSVALHAALSRVEWLADYRLLRVDDETGQQWQLLLSFRPGRTVDLREAVAAVTVLAIPRDQRSRFTIACRTLVDCRAEPVR